MIFKILSEPNSWFSNFGYNSSFIAFNSFEKRFLGSNNLSAKIKALNCIGLIAALFKSKILSVLKASMSLHNL